jgi:hypothetical protein
MAKPLRRLARSTTLGMLVFSRHSKIQVRIISQTNTPQLCAYTQVPATIFRGKFFVSFVTLV